MAGDGMRASDLKEAIAEALDDPIRQEGLKNLMKEAHEEWLDKKWAELGKWTFRGVVAAAFSVIVYFYFVLKGKGLL